MIKLSEIRVGNWTRCNSGLKRPGDPAQIAPMMIRQIAAMPEGECHNYDYIPLDEEWLEKWGFDFTHGCWEKNGIKIGEYEEWEGEETFRLEISEWVAFIAPELKYVHQLQNLFYSLTGEELSINL